MLKRTFFLWVICLSSIVNSQTKIAQFTNSLKTSSSNIKDVIPIVNTKNGDFAIFIADAKNVYAYKLDSTYSVKEKMASEEKRRKFKVIIGSSISEDNENYRVFLSDVLKMRFISFNFSFQDGKTSTKEFKLEKGERFIQTVSSKNELYLIATSAIKKAMYIYTFDQAGNPTKNEIDLSTIEFISNRGKAIDISKLLTSSQSVKKIEENTPNSVEIAASETKMYIRDHSIVFTFDENNDFTQILNIDLQTLQASYISFDKPMRGVKWVDTNSYINGDKIFTIASIRERLEMEVIDYNSGEVIKKYQILKDEPITFKNTPIIQEGGIYKNYREMEKTKKFLRKIHNGDIGLSVLQRNNQYEVTLGGYVLQTSGGGGMSFGMGGIGVPIGGAGGVTVFYNPTFFAYGSYTSSKSTRIECLFDDSFNHLEGEIEKNAFDKMDGYDSPIKAAETVFKYKNFFIKGSYSSVTKGYSLRLFTN